MDKLVNEVCDLLYNRPDKWRIMADRIIYDEHGEFSDFKQPEGASIWLAWESGRYLLRGNRRHGELSRWATWRIKRAARYAFKQQALANIEDTILMPSKPAVEQSI